MTVVELEVPGRKTGLLEALKEEGVYTTCFDDCLRLYSLGISSSVHQMA